MLTHFFLYMLCRYTSIHLLRYVLMDVSEFRNDDKDKRGSDKDKRGGDKDKRGSDKDKRESDKDKRGRGNDRRSRTRSDSRYVLICIYRDRICIFTI